MKAMFFFVNPLIEKFFTEFSTIWANLYFFCTKRQKEVHIQIMCTENLFKKVCYQMLLK